MKVVIFPEKEIHLFLQILSFMKLTEQQHSMELTSACRGLKIKQNL